VTSQRDGGGRAKLRLWELGGVEMRLGVRPAGVSKTTEEAQLLAYFVLTLSHSQACRGATLRAAPGGIAQSVHAVRQVF